MSKALAKVESLLNGSQIKFELNQSWETTHGRRDPGWPAKTLLTTLIEDAEVESRDELATLLADCEVWPIRHRVCVKF